MDAKDQIPEKYLQPCRLDGDNELEPSVPDIQNHMQYRRNIKFFLDFEDSGRDGIIVKLAVIGYDADGKEAFDDEHEFDECLDIEHLLFEQPIVLASLKNRMGNCKLADLGRHLVELYVAWATAYNVWGACFIADDTSDTDGEFDKKLLFELTVGNSPDLHLTLPWSYASKYFIVPEEK